MLVAIVKKSEIKRAQREFLERMENVAEKHGVTRVGHQGRRWKEKACWNSRLDIWWVMDKAKNRYWNAFGTQQPIWNGNTSDIVCEINSPFYGVNRRIGGVFAKDTKGRTYVVHSRKIGGGRPGIGKQLFVKHFRGKWKDVTRGNSIERLAFVGLLAEKKFPNRISDFVHQVQEMKVPRVS